MYINRGLIETADNETELAGVMAHEMAHVALRHGTNQASKAFLAQAGLGVLGSLIGNGQGGTGQMIEAVGGFGLNTVFLKFSRSAEEQADIVGAQTLVKAGYDPRGMVRFFEKMGDMSGGDSGKFEQFFSTHPAPSDRARRVEEEMAALGRVRPVGSAGDFEAIRAELGRLPQAPSMQELMKSGNSGEPSSRKK
jgi:predicted Zn-dependent protease